MCLKGVAFKPTLSALRLAASLNNSGYFHSDNINVFISSRTSVEMLHQNIITKCFLSLRNLAEKCMPSKKFRIFLHKTLNINDTPPEFFPNFA